MSCRSLSYVPTVRDKWINALTSHSARFFALFDQFPKFASLAKLGVFGYRQLAPEKEIAKRVLVQDSMDPDAFVSLGEIDAVIFRTIAI